MNHVLVVRYESMLIQRGRKTASAAWVEAKIVLTKATLMPSLSRLIQQKLTRPRVFRIKLLRHLVNVLKKACILVR